MMVSVSKEYQLGDNDSLKDISKAKKKKELSDVILTCDGGDVEAHRRILSAQCPYFQKMFLSNFKEQSTNKLDFSYVKKDVMLLIISYIYQHQVTVKSDESIDNLMQIYQMSRLFEINGLSKYCWKLILINLNTNDWLKIWELVLLHGTNQQVCKVIIFILENLSEIVKKHFLTLNYSQIHSLVEKINQNKILIEDDFVEAILQWSQKTNQPKAHLQAIFLQLNFSLISVDFMISLVEKENDVFEDTFFKQFFKLHFLPKLKTDSEVDLPFPLKLFFFRCYRKLDDLFSVPGKARLEIFDCEKKSFCKVIDNLPFRYSKTFTTIQCGSEIYIFGGIPNGCSDCPHTKSFMLFDWKKNDIVMKPSLLEEAIEPVTCISKNNIYVLQRWFRSQETSVQYFSITDQKWFAKRYKDLHVIACVNVKGIIYLVCERSSSYCLMTLNELECTFHSHTPLPADHKINKYNVTTFRGKIFVLIRNLEWYIFDPKTRIWNIKKASIPLDYPVRLQQCFAKQFLMFYNETDHGLYRFHTNNLNVKKIMSVSESLEDYLTLDYCLSEQMLFFH